MGSIDSVSLDYIKGNAKAVVEASPVAYIRYVKSRGSIFNPEDSRVITPRADTGFFIDHEELLEASIWVRVAIEYILSG